MERQIRDIVKYAVDEGYESVMFPNGRTIAFVERWVGETSQGISPDIRQGSRFEMHGEEYVMIGDPSREQTVSVARDDGEVKIY